MNSRVALAPINLNSTPNTPNRKLNTPNRKSPNRKLASPTRTPSFKHDLKRIPRPNSTDILITPNTTLSPSKPYSIKKLPNSFSEYRSPSIKTPVKLGKIYKSQNTQPSIDLAVTKLKLKLQLAIYKLKQNSSTKTYKLTSKTYLTPPSDSDFVDSSPRDEILSSIFKQPSPAPKNYKSSININLKNPSLNKVGKKSNYNLKLFQIKKNSSFYNVQFKKLPLVDSPPKPIHINHLQLNKNPFIHDTFKDSFNDDLKNNPSVYLNPLYNKSYESKSGEITSQTAHNLPSINIILKTPIKNSKNYLLNKSLNLPRAQVVTDDTTIDEDGDQTIINNTHDNVLSSIKDGGRILTSSPCHNQFATPNSFSVAKSLLQLGGYNYN